MKKHIPNTLTCLNILSGCIACIMAFSGNYPGVVICIIAAAIFDFLDGFSARLLQAYSPIGKELDSLADMVSFGLVPSIMVFTLLSSCLTQNEIHIPYIQFTPYLSFLLTIFSALRLAKFNIDERQSTSFIGLPTPANALFWISLCYWVNKSDLQIHNLAFYPILVLIICFSLLMTSEIPMFSLKIKGLSFKENRFRYLLLLFMLVTVIMTGMLGIALGILFYIILSWLSSRQQMSIHETE